MLSHTPSTHASRLLRARSLFMIGAVVSVLSMGAGCQAPKLPSFQKASESANSETARLEAAAKLVLAPGDSFDVNQTFFGFGGVITQLSALTKGSRTVQVAQYASLSSAELSWQTVLDRETDASRTARADAETLRLKGMASGTGPIPEPVIERVVTTGTVTQINLKDAHELYLPTYWNKGENRLQSEKSAIWLSDDAFQELTRTKKTVLDLGYLASGATGIVKNMTDLRNALNKLRNEAQGEEQKKDPLLLELISDQEEVSLVINGKETKVAVIRARNWFGEVVVLNNRQNPLILKATFNPLATGAAEIMGSEKGLKTLFGYEIKNINAAAF